MGKGRGVSVGAVPVVDLLSYCYEDIDRHGNVRIYVWRGKGYRKKRLRETPGTAAFRAAYDKALATSAVATPPPGSSTPGTLRWLVQRYFADAPAFKALGDRTRYVRRGIIEKCLEEMIAPDSADKFADFPLSQLTPKALRVLRDRKVDKPEAANARVKAWRHVFAWAADDDDIALKANPARDVKYIKTASTGFHTWTPDEVKQYEDRHAVGTKPRLALALLLYTGARRSDVVRLGLQMIADGWLTFREMKGAAHAIKERELPVLPILQDVIDNTKTGNLTFLVTEFGAPFTVAGFGNWFADRCKEAGVPGRAHGLRKAGATLAAENGATERQLMAIFGWTSGKQATAYTRAANRKKLAGDAMHMLVRTAVPTQTENGTFPTFPGGKDLGRKA